MRNHHVLADECCQSYVFRFHFLYVKHFLPSACSLFFVSPVASPKSHCHIYLKRKSSLFSSFGLYTMSNYPYEYIRCLDMEQIRESPQTQSHSLEGFVPLLTLTEGCGALLVILVTIWTCYYRHGFSWRSNPQLEFNWHPLLMIVGLVFLYANAMLIYRTQRNVRKRRLKLTHAGIMLFIVLLIVIALVAVFDSHNLASPPIPNMYSLHSWVGLTTVILFCCQWVAGCVSFLFPGLQPPLRASYIPLHVYFGITAFVGAIASCLLGLNEKAIFALGDKYSIFVSEGILINFIGLLLISFGGLSIYLVTQERYRRLPRPEDEVLLSG